MAFEILPEWVSAPNTLTLTTVIVLSLTFILKAWIKRRKFIERVNKVPGPGNGGYTLLGDAKDVGLTLIFMQVLILKKFILIALCLGHDFVVWG